LLVAAEPERLPSNVKPISYDLALKPDAEKLTFSGQVHVAIDVTSSAESVVVNQDRLTVDQATLDATQTAISVTPDQKLQRVTLAFDRPISAGRHTLTLDYHGSITTGTEGFFAMDYDSPAGKRRTLATNFEPASERRFMPSWDEPALKATFRLTVDVPSKRMAVSNMPIESTEPLGGGRERVHFATSPKMSTYLFFLGIGDFERISTKSDGTEVGVVVNRGDTEKGQYALQQAARILHYYNKYFAIAYPLPKLDLVVAPGSITGGAMENWGAIFYSQNSLLFDPKRSTESARQGVFETVAHEMAHQWFGDLVTMEWWDNLWLNEGFASWMQTHVADDLHPEWKIRLQALDFFERGKRADAKPSTHPILQPVLDAAQAEQAFDDITYDKGASVITMLEKYAGSNGFRDGVRKYMRAHAYGNSVDADLWQSVQENAGKPVLESERDFTTQPGLPLIKTGVSVSKGKTFVTLSYERFYEDPSGGTNGRKQIWHIPVLLGSDDQTIAVLLTDPDGYSAVAPTHSGPLIVNAGQSTFARTLYSQPQFVGIHASFASIRTVDQLGILLDYWAFGQSGYAPVPDYLELARATPASADPLVWMQISAKLRDIDALYANTRARDTFRKFARGLLQPVAMRLGWEPQPSEEPNDGRLRSAVLQSLARLGDSEVISEARKRLDAALADSPGITPATRRAVIAIAAAHADAATVDRIMAKISGTKDPLEKENLLVALLRNEDPEQANRILDFTLGRGAVAGFTPYAFGVIAPAHPDLAWQRAMRYFAQPGASVDPLERLVLMPNIAAASSEPKRIDELEKYAKEHIPESARESVESAIATIKLNSKFQSSGIPEIDRWLAAQ
jgi:aminopeptidase N